MCKFCDGEGFIVKGKIMDACLHCTALSEFKYREMKRRIIRDEKKEIN